MANDPRTVTALVPAAALPLQRLHSLVESHVDFIWRSLRRLGIAERDLPDAAQQVFVVAARKLDQIKEGSERPFLYQTALRIASTLRRSQRRRREVSDELLENATDQQLAPDELAEPRYRRRLLDSALDAMPLDLRATFVLIEIEELTMAEAAVLLMVPAGTVASRLRRARIRFQKEVQRLREREGV